MSVLADHTAILIADRIGARPADHHATAELASRVERRAAALGLGAREYAARLAAETASSDGSPDGWLDGELGHLAAPLTNGWTWLWRDQPALDALCAELAGRAAGRPVALWVAGCSTGEEAYGAAIAALEAGLDARVLGTDIDVARLAIARRAVYGAHALRRTPPRVLERYFEPAPNGQRRLAREVRERVEILQHNLLTPAPLRAGGWDAIVCRNVLLHCSAGAQRRIRERIEAALRTGGRALYGATERLRLEPAVEPTLPRAMAPRAAAVRAAAVRAMAPRAMAPRAAAPRAMERQGPAPAIDAPPAPRREPTVAALIALGGERLAARDFEGARRAYEGASELDPQSAEVALLFGVVHRKRGAWEQALMELRRAVFLDDELWPASYLLAGTLERLGEPERARVELERTLASLERRPRVSWRWSVEDLDAMAARPEEVRRACLERLRARGGALRPRAARKASDEAEPSRARKEQ